MTPPAAVACPLGIAEETLSTWHDGLLGADERARIAGHVTTCAACQERLADFERVGWLLRGQAAPDLRAPVWSGLQLRMDDEERVRARIRWRPEWRKVAAVAAAVLLVALFASLLANRGPRTTGPAAGTVTPQPSATPSSLTPTATAAPVQIPDGWTAAYAGTANVPRMAFAPSAPDVAYAVMIDVGANQTVVSGSHDGGKTWQRLATPTGGQQDCQISVDPADASDVVLACILLGASGSILLRSTDGGGTWATPQIPGTVDCYSSGAMGWAGSTLLMWLGICDSTGTQQAALVASINKRPFVRLDKDGALGGMHLGWGSDYTFAGHGATIYVNQGFVEWNPTYIEETTVMSSDGGASWRTVTFSDGGRRVYLLAVSPDGGTLAGVYEDAPTQITVSRDDGRMWRKLPAPWSLPAGTQRVVGSFGAHNIFVAPDGTVLVRDVTVPSLDPAGGRLYVASPGATSWRIALDAPWEAILEAAATDASGHPTAIWAFYYPFTAPGPHAGDWLLISHRV